MAEAPDKLKAVLRALDAGLAQFYGERYRGLILYGSYARGEAHEGSDVDLLLLLEGPVNIAREIHRAGEVVSPLSLEADLLLSVIPMDIFRYQQGRGGFLRNVHDDGIKAA